MDWIRQKWPYFKIAIVSLICLLSAGIGGHFLYLDVNELGRQGKGKVLGKVEQRESKVKRKSSSSYVWNNVLSSEDLFLKDSIQTGHGSAVSIRMTDGSLLDVGEDSLVVMDDTTQLSLNFLRGSVVVHKSDGGDSKITVGKDGHAKVEQLAARLLKPDPLARFFTPSQASKKVTLTWQISSKASVDEYSLQISTDKQFSPKNTQSSQVSKLTQHAFELNLDPGKYFWRLVSKNKPLSETRQFRVSSVAPLRPLWPPHMQQITMVGTDPSVQFRWATQQQNAGEDSESLGEHRIEVARDPEFKGIVQSQIIQSSSNVANLRGIPEGAFFWRIKSNYGNIVLESEGRAFGARAAVAPAPTPSSRAIASASTAPTPTPTPIPIPLLPYPSTFKPDAGASLTLLRPKQPLEITWSEVKGAELYEVTVYNDQETDSSKRIVFHSKIEKNSIPVKQFGPGSFSWTVRAIDKHKIPGESLPLKKFVLTYGEVLSAPKILSPEVQ